MNPADASAMASGLITKPILIWCQSDPAPDARVTSHHKAQSNFGTPKSPRKRGQTANPVSQNRVPLS